MEKACFVFTIKAGREADYDRAHAAVWPELETALGECGFHDYTVWRHGTQIVVTGAFEPDFDTAMACLGGKDVNARWGEHMSDIIERIVDDNGSLFRASPVYRFAGDVT